MSTLPKLRIGSRGPFVRELQLLLNRKLSPSPNLATDSDFGPRTRAAVLRFQGEHWLEEDGVVGDCTWNALKDMERYAILDSSTRLVPQPTATTCWAAATAMLVGRAAPVGPAGATVVAGGLANDSELNDPRNSRVFASAYGLTMTPPQSWTPDGLAGVLRAHGRVMMNTLWDASEYALGRGSSGHMRIIAGIRGDGTSEGTTIRIYDPWPPARGAIYSRTYGPFIRRNPASTYQLYYR